MAEEFEAAPAAGICGGAWWGSLRSVPPGILSPCSSGIGADARSFAQLQYDSKPRIMPCANNNSICGISSVVPPSQTPKAQTADSDSGGSSVTMDSTLHMQMGLGFSSPGTFSPDWNQSLMQGNAGRAGGYNSMMQRQEINSNMIEPTSYPYNSTLIQGLFEPDHQSHQLDQSSLLQTNQHSLDYSYMSGTAASYMNDFLPPLSWPKTDRLPRPCLPNSKQQQACAFDVSSTAFSNTFLPCPQPQPQQLLATSTFGQKHASRAPTVTRKVECTAGESRGGDSGRPASKKANDEPATKRPRVSTPSPLPTFKVRKENLRDQITALQQLVSPFGKTDTASVLQEAIECIKFLHDQVSVLSTPYMKGGASLQHQQSCNGSKDVESHNQDLSSRGLCLVPLPSTFPVANETAADFWTPNFGANFR